MILERVIEPFFGALMPLIYMAAFIWLLHLMHSMKVSNNKEKEPASYLFLQTSQIFVAFLTALAMLLYGIGTYRMGQEAARTNDLKEKELKWTMENTRTSTPISVPIPLKVYFTQIDVGSPLRHYSFPTFLLCKPLPFLKTPHYVESLDQAP
jgi:heme/copper-type cytochrome/quinol oxidase subunit 2